MELSTEATRQGTGAFHGKSVLVTGGAGAIGSNLVASLNRLPIERITILDNLSSAYEWNLPKGKRIHFIRGDVVDDQTLRTIFSESPQVVYHLAAAAK